MKSFRQWSAGLLAAILIFTLAPSVSAKNAVSSGAIVQAALPEIGYVEGANEYSKYGKWYGFSNSYWCAMFVSWCANQGGVPTYLVPKGAYCPYMVKAFQNALGESIGHIGEKELDICFYKAKAQALDGKTKDALATYDSIIKYNKPSPIS